MLIYCFLLYFPLKYQRKIDFTHVPCLLHHGDSLPENRNDKQIQGQTDGSRHLPAFSLFWELRLAQLPRFSYEKRVHEPVLFKTSCSNNSS